jgi:hypothetical protein
LSNPDSPPAGSALDRALKIFGDVRPGEGRHALLMFFNIFLLLVAYYILETVREPLILTIGGAQLKSYAAGAQAAVLLAVPFPVIQFDAHAEVAPVGGGAGLFDGRRVLTEHIGNMRIVASIRRSGLALAGDRHPDGQRRQPEPCLSWRHGLSSAKLATKACRMSRRAGMPKAEKV